MAFDEYIYGKISDYFRSKKQISSEEKSRIVYLDEIKDKLTIVARAVTGRSIDIFHAEREGGYKNKSFFLPSSFSMMRDYEENYQFYLFRILYLSVQKKLNINLQNNKYNSEDSNWIDVVLGNLFNEYPITKEWHSQFIDALETKQTTIADNSWLYGKLMMDSDKSTDDLLQNASSETKKLPDNKKQTTIQAKAVEEIINIIIDQKQQDDYVLTHNFEKVDTAEEFDGVWRDFDGDDDLKDHEKALEELSMKYTVRVDDPTHSVYQADFIENSSIHESAQKDKNSYYLKYNEWDESKNCYKLDYCKLFPVKLTQQNEKFYYETIQKNATTLGELRKMVAHLNNKLQLKRRQSQGDEYDLDAVTDLLVDINSGHTSSENIYLSNRKKEKDLSILLLVDISLSSDGYAAGNRIIDMEKQVSILFGEILNEFNIDFSIQSFYSKTRNFSTYQTIKDFDQSWNQSKYIIGGIEPEGYTRIGTALRHSGTIIGKRPCSKKWIILLSDGKPNDFDRYEGNYGICDVKKALAEFNEINIHTYALAIEAKAKFYLPQMFGQNNFQILSTPNELLNSMVKLLVKIKNQST